MHSFFKKFLLCLGLNAFLLLPAHAQSLSNDITKQYQTGAAKAEISAVDPREAVTGIIQLILTLLGTVFLGLTVLAGYWLLTARGEEDKVEKATKTIRGAIIGLIITLAAYSITLFVGNSAHDAVTPGGMDRPDTRLKWSDLNRD